MLRRSRPRREPPSAARILRRKSSLRRACSHAGRAWRGFEGAAAGRAGCCCPALALLPPPLMPPRAPRPPPRPPRCPPAWPLAPFHCSPAPAAKVESVSVAGAFSARVAAPPNPTATAPRKKVAAPRKRSAGVGGGCGSAAATALRDATSRPFCRGTPPTPPPALLAAGGAASEGGGAGAPKEKAKAAEGGAAAASPLPSSPSPLSNTALTRNVASLCGAATMPRNGASGATRVPRAAPEGAAAGGSPAAGMASCDRPAAAAAAPYTSSRHLEIGAADGTSRAGGAAAASSAGPPPAASEGAVARLRFCPRGLLIRDRERLSPIPLFDHRASSLCPYGIHSFRCGRRWQQSDDGPRPLE